MTIRSEIRAALAGGPANAASMLAKVPSLAGDARKLLWNLNALRDEGRIRIAGTTEEGPLYNIDQWEVTATGRSVSAPRGTGPRAKKGTGKSTKPARGKDAKRDAGKRKSPLAKAVEKSPGLTLKPPRKAPPKRGPHASTAGHGAAVERAAKALVPAPIAAAGDADQYEVGLMSDGGLMVHNVTQGQIETMPPAFTQQVAQLLQIAAGRH